MKETKNISYKLLIVMIIISLIITSIVIPSIAYSSDYSLTDKTITLDGENDGTVEVSLITAEGGTFYALQAGWTLSEKESTNYFTLSNLVSGGTTSPMENDPATGRVLWTDGSYTGFDVSEGGSIWTATYTIDKDTPAGTYTVELTVDAITGGTAEYDSDENFSLTATITVEREENVTPYMATFCGDNDGIDSICVYNSQSDEEGQTFSSISETVAYARDSSSGEILTDGNGQINFKVIPKTGYTVSVVVSPTSNYKNLKLPSELGIDNMYRITKITGDLTITVTASQNPYTGTFESDSGVSGIDIYYTQDYESDSTVEADETNVTTAIARDGSTGEQNTSGSGQINFKVNLNENYLIDTITVTGGYKNLKDSSDTGIENMFRITKITSDLTITVTTKKRVSIVPEIYGYEESYEYTGSSIKPEITVNIYGTETILTEGIDYTVSYGTNTKLGTGSIVISPVDTSDYIFTETSANFNIVEKEINENDVTVQSSITYTGSDLYPDVVVYTNGTTLIKDTDYKVTYSNQNGQANEYIIVTIEGIGNYTGSVTKTVLITPYTITESDVSLEYTTVRYDGTKKEPKVTVTVNGKIISSSNYAVSYENNTEIGTATVTITATGSNFNTTADSVKKTFTIADKEVLEISGISNNQNITYTGSKVVLSGILTISNNDNDITVEDLKTTWYDEEGDEIERPTDVGSYSVTYSYVDSDYIGSLSINFVITKATSNTPNEVSTGLIAIEGQSLGDVTISTIGLEWGDSETEILTGNHSYYATYTQNNDTKNYTTETISINVYGRTYIDISTNVSGTGGTISDSLKNVLEGTIVTLTVTPDEGYEIDKITVNGTEKEITNNTLEITAGTEDLTVSVSFKIATSSVNDSDGTSESENIENTDKTTVTSTIPQTGETQMKFLRLGIILMLVVLIIIIYKKRKLNDI